MVADGSTAAGDTLTPAATLVPDGIAILGSHPETKSLAPFAENWLIYACSPDNSPHGFSPHTAVLPRVDEWFEVHVPVFDRTRPYAYLHWLRNVPKVWMRDRTALALKDSKGLPLFPNAELYPEDQLKAIFGPFCFTSSIAYIMAKAIMDAGNRGIKRIGLWGIMQMGKDEYINQRPGIQALMVVAHASGIEIHLPPQAAHLFESPPENF